MEEVKDKPKKEKQSTMGVRRMALQMWCVFAIASIEYIHMITASPSTYITLVAIVMIGALGGVDAWKQGILDKAKIGT